MSILKELFMTEEEKEFKSDVIKECLAINEAFLKELETVEETPDLKRFKTAVNFINKRILSPLTTCNTISEYKGLVEEIKEVFVILLKLDSKKDLDNFMPALHKGLIKEFSNNNALHDTFSIQDKSKIRNLV